MLHRFAFIGLAVLVAGASACTQISSGPGSASARREVSRARTLAREVDTAVSENRLGRLRDSAACDGGAVLMQATLFSDAAGKPRKYVLEGRSGDSVHYIFYYYDTAGQLRLIDSDQRSGKNSQRTSHSYFDAKGKSVHKDERVTGARTTFPEAPARLDPKADLQSLTDPASGCRRVPYRE